MGKATMIPEAGAEATPSLSSCEGVRHFFVIKLKNILIYSPFGPYIVVALPVHTAPISIQQMCRTKNPILHVNVSSQFAFFSIWIVDF